MNPTWTQAMEFADTKLGDMTPKQREVFGLIFFKQLRNQRPMLRPNANYAERVFDAFLSAVDQTREVAP